MTAIIFLLLKCLLLITRTWLNPGVSEIRRDTRMEVNKLEDKGLQSLEGTSMNRMWEPGCSTVEYQQLRGPGFQ